MVEYCDDPNQLNELLKLTDVEKYLSSRLRRRPALVGDAASAERNPEDDFDDLEEVDAEDYHKDDPPPDEMEETSVGLVVACLSSGDVLDLLLAAIRSVVLKKVSILLQYLRSTSSNL